MKKLAHSSTFSYTHLITRQFAQLLESTRNAMSYVLCNHTSFSATTQLCAISSRTAIAPFLLWLAAQLKISAFLCSAFLNWPAMAWQHCVCLVLKRPFF
jgi:hypothetical protein